jgi:hypothetical protein
MLRAMRLPALLLAGLVALAPEVAHARGAKPASGEHPQHRTGRHHRGHHHRVKRDAAQRRAFERTHPCPSTGKTSGACPGFVVDHIRALKHGGADRPWNMQWQSTAEAKAKDRWE